MERFLNQIARDVRDPKNGNSIWSVIREKRLEDAGENLQARKEIHGRRDLRIAALGSGSDYTVFLDHLAIASTDVSFSDSGVFGVYHSIYDSFDWYRRFGDPEFLYGKTLAELHAIAISRMALSLIHI